MFIGTLVSTYNILNLIKRIWKDAHSQQFFGEYDDISIMDQVVGDEENAEDIEFTEFLVNFTKD